MAHIPNSKLADDVATRFEVPIDHDDPVIDSTTSALPSALEENGINDLTDANTQVKVANQPSTLSHLFHILSSQGEFSEYTVEKGTLESVFMKVIRENGVGEEIEGRRRHNWWCV